MGKLIPELESYRPDLTNEKTFSDSTSRAVQSYFRSVTTHTRNIGKDSRNEKNMIEKALIKDLVGTKAYNDFKNKYFNKSLSDLVRNKSVLDKVDEKYGRLIRKHELGYMKPTSRYGRAHLYAPNKQIGRYEIDTLWFNVVAIWLYSLFFYLTLRTDLLRKAMTISERRKLSRKAT